MSVVAYRLRAMNTDIALLAPTLAPSFDHACSVVDEVFSEVERCLSRFLPYSELVAFNQSNGTPFRASPLLFEAISLAVSAAEATDGVLDPTILSALEHAGYDRSFEQVAAAAGTAHRARQPAVLPDYRAIHCDPHARTIRLVAGQRIDLGGIGKGLAVDRALEATAFLRDRCIAAGGDVAVRGTAGFDGDWTIALEDTGDDRPRSIALRDAAVATSTISKRRWQVDGQERHHLIDTRTGRPSCSPFRTVTVVAASCVQADVAAKTALVLGEEGITFLERRGMHGFAVRHDGSTVSTSQWPKAGGHV